MTDRLFGIVGAVLSLLFLLFAVPSISGDWQSGPDARYFTVGPRLFPYIAGSLTLFFTFAIALHPSAESKLKLFNSGAGRKNMLMAFTIGLIFVVMLDVLGFVLAGILVLASFLTCFGERRWHIILPLSIGVPILVKLIFIHGFVLELPSGRFAFPI